MQLKVHRRYPWQVALSAHEGILASFGCEDSNWWVRAKKSAMLDFSDL